MSFLMSLNESLCLPCLFSRPQNCAIQWWIHISLTFQIHHPTGVNFTTPAPLLVVVSNLIYSSFLSPKLCKNRKMFLLLSDFLYGYIWSLAHVPKMRFHGYISSEHITTTVYSLQSRYWTFRVRPVASSQWLCISTSFTDLALFSAILTMDEESMIRSSTPLSEQYHD